MPYEVVRPDEVEWTTRPAEPGEPDRHVAGLTDRAGFTHTRGNLWRYEPGAKGRRHRDLVQEETFVVIRGTLSMYLGDPPERHEVPQGGLVHGSPGRRSRSSTRAPRTSSSTPTGHHPSAETPSSSTRPSSAGVRG